jgi:hypothetical protein
MSRYSPAFASTAIFGAMLLLSACASQNYQSGHGHGHSHSHGHGHASSESAQSPSADLPQAAQAACFQRFNEPGQQQIKTVSPLKPGYWEVIITGKQGRQVACTVDQNGAISDWVNM